MSLGRQAMIHIVIDNQPYEVEEGGNLLHVCLKLGFDLPYFCWHPAMHSVGACRMCAVKQFKNEADTRGRIIMSCMTEVTENMRISVDDPQARAHRAGISELLMLNHPHDCPVCDEGGECHLQDMTVMTGHVYRRTRFKKRTYRNQDLGPFLNHEMNRCIHCYRCVRFYCDYAGGRDFAVFGSHHRIYFGRREDGVLQNPFSGNLAEVCPTGVFTDKTLKRHFTRTWDLQTAPSLCVHCGLGCNIIPGERYGMLRRIRNRFNSEVNGYFLCDRGRFGYEFVNDNNRIKFPLQMGNEAGPAAVRVLNDSEALEQLQSLLAGEGMVMGIGSPRASLEANYALRTLVGPEAFFAGLSRVEGELFAEAVHILRSGPARSASLRDVELSDAILVLGEDVMNTSPRLALALRQAVRNKPREEAGKQGIPLWNDTVMRVAMQDSKGPLYSATPAGTALDELAERTCHGAPDDLARLGFAIAHALDKTAPAVSGLSDEQLFFAEEIALILKKAERPLVISGTSLGSKALLQAAANVARALCANDLPAALSLVLPECNSMGMALLAAGSLDDAFAFMADNNVTTLIILENDLYRRAEEEGVTTFLNGAATIIVLDYLPNRTAAHAHILLPAGSYAESTGTLVNCEGRAQRFFKVFVPEKGVRESAAWLREMLGASPGKGAGWQSIDDITVAMARELAIFSPLTDLAPLSGCPAGNPQIPRQTLRASGRTAIDAAKTMHEPPPPADPDTPFSFSMEGCRSEPPSSLLPRYWYPGWNSVQSLTKFQREPGGQLHGGPSGQRLIEPGAATGESYFIAIPAAFEAREGELLFVARAHLFGSEELSSFAPGIGEVAERPHLALSAVDAKQWGVGAGESVTIIIGDKQSSCHLPVRIDATLVQGVAAVPVGLPGMPCFPLPFRGKIVKAGQASEIEED